MALHALAAGRTDDAGVPARGLRARPADRRRAAALRLRATDGEGIARRGRHRGLLRAARWRRGGSAEIEAYVLERSDCKRARSARKPIRASSTICCSRALAGLGASLSKFAADVRILSQPGLRRDLRAVRRSASRQFVDAVQAEPDSLRAHRLARAAASRVRRRRVAERRDELSRAHARRQRQPPHDSARSDALRRRDRHARAQGRRGAARRRAPHRRRTCARTRRSPGRKPC